MSEPTTLGRVGRLHGRPAELSVALCAAAGPLVHRIPHRPDARRDELAAAVALLHATLFIIGFTIIFMLFGASATALGRVLKFHEVWLQRIRGILIIVFGLVCLGVFRFSFLQQERRLHLQDKPLGYLGSVFVGMAFAAGWTSLHRADSGRDLRAGRGLRQSGPRGAPAGGVLGRSRGAVSHRGLRGERLPRLVPALPEIPALGDEGERSLLVIGWRDAPHRTVHPDLRRWLQGWTPEGLFGRL